MPIEIKELIIRATVVDNSHSHRQKQKQEIDLSQLKRELIQECVSRLRKKKDQKNSR